MNPKEFTYLLENPGTISAGQTRQLEEILMESPYFQAVRAMRLKGLKEHQSFRYNSALKKTAAYTTDREVLFDFISSPEFNQNEIAAQIKEQEKRLKEIPVFEPEEVFGKRSIAIDEAIKMKQSESDRVMDPALFEKAPEKKEAEEKEKLSEEANAKDQLGIGEPLVFNPSESHSFSEWLQLTSAKPIKSDEEEEEDAEEEKKTDSEEENDPLARKFELIDEFISKSPKIKPGKSSSKTNLADHSTVAPEALMTETLAKVYLEQKNYKKAIQAYKILILKNPEKSGFFADQIRAIEKVQENNTD